MAGENTEHELAIEKFWVKYALYVKYFFLIVTVTVFFFFLLIND